MTVALFRKLRKRAFTLPEVALAIGVIALGLVGVFSILPFGLTAQKNNQEETIIRYEAQYWHEVLLSDGLLLEDINERVDRVEVQRGKFTHTFINPRRGRLVPGANEIVSYVDIASPGATPYPLDYTDFNGTRAWSAFPANSLSLAKAKKYWSSDVQGWLLKLNDIDPADPDEKNKPWGDSEGNFVLVRAVNGALFDRFYGAEPESDEYHFPNRDFSTGYILQVQPENNDPKTGIGYGQAGSSIKMTFYWPLLEEVVEMLEPKPTAAIPNAKNRFDLIRNVIALSEEPDSFIKFKKKSFTIKQPGRIEKALTEDMLTLQERRFMKEMRVLRPGERIDSGDPRLKGLFNPYHSGLDKIEDDNGYPWLVDNVLPPKKYGGPRRINLVGMPKKIWKAGGDWDFDVTMPLPIGIKDREEAHKEYHYQDLDPFFRPDEWNISLPEVLQSWSRFGPENIVTPIGHSGMWLYPYGAADPLQIAWVPGGKVARYRQRAWFGKENATTSGDEYLLYKAVDLPAALSVKDNYIISFLGKGQTWAGLLDQYARTREWDKPSNPSPDNQFDRTVEENQPPRPALVEHVGGDFMLSKRLRVTAHRPATLDEKSINKECYTSLTPIWGAFETRRNWVPYSNPTPPLKQVMVPWLWRVSQ